MNGECIKGNTTGQAVEACRGADMICLSVFDWLCRILLLLLLGVTFCQAASTTIMSPTGDESWAVGSSHVITWKSAAPLGKVDISFSADGGATWDHVADQVPDSGQFIWKIPNHQSKACKIRIGSESSRSFSIIPSQEVTNYRWVQATAQASFAPRDGAGALAYDNRMWLIGGWNDDAEIFPRIGANDVWSSEDGSTWTLV